MSLFLLLLANLALTILFCFLLGPAAYKLEKFFGLIGWAGRAPFYIVHFYIGLFIVLLLGTHSWIYIGTGVGFLMSMPLAFWTYSAKCPKPVPFLRMGFGLLHGVSIAYLASKLGSP